MTKIIIFLFLSFSFNLYCQETLEQDGFLITLIEAKKDPSIKGIRSYNIPTQKGFKKVKVGLKVASLNRKKLDFDPNKLYIVNKNHKVRIRPIDVEHNWSVSFKSLGYLSTKKTYADYPRYDPNIIDTFNDYSIEGFEDIEPQITFANSGLARPIKIYFQHKDIKRNTLNFYFNVPEEFKDFELFYGDIRMTSFSIKTKIR